MNFAPKITSAVYHSILSTIGCRPAECGGILGAGDDGVISEYYFDATGYSSPDGYAPDVNTINAVLSNEWMPRNILMVGIVHSHSNMNRVPSCGDMSYGIRILQALDTVDRFYLPILTQAEDEFILDCYVIRPDPERQFICQKVDYSIVE